MRVVVLADTHIPDFAKALPPALLRALRTADVILHAGDVTSRDVLDELSAFGPVHVALGNNDRPEVRSWGAKEDVRLDIEGVPVAMVHDAGPRSGRERRMRRRFPEARLVVYGHSHIPMDVDADGIRLFNPGSPTWKRRQPFPTYGLLALRRGSIRSRIVELRS